MDDPAGLIEAYFERGWTDGLPVVPPTEKAVAEMLAGAGMRGDEILGEIPGRNTVVVADKVAINAVLAGCRPEYMPVVAAAIRALCHPDFAYHGPASTLASAGSSLEPRSTSRERGFNTDLKSSVSSGLGTLNRLS